MAPAIFLLGTGGKLPESKLENWDGETRLQGKKFQRRSWRVLSSRSAVQLVRKFIRTKAQYDDFR